MRRRWVTLLRHWFALRNTTSWTLALLYSLYFRSLAWDFWKSSGNDRSERKVQTAFAFRHRKGLLAITHRCFQHCEMLSAHLLRQWFTDYIRQLNQVTTTADVSWPHLIFSRKPLDRPSMWTSTDCWVFAWVWRSATSQLCWAWSKGYWIVNSSIEWHRTANNIRRHLNIRPVAWCSAAILVLPVTSSIRRASRYLRSARNMLAAFSPRILSDRTAVDPSSTSYLLRVFMYFVVMLITWTLAIFGYLAVDSKYCGACLNWAGGPQTRWSCFVSFVWTLVAFLLLLVMHLAPK